MAFRMSKNGTHLPERIFRMLEIYEQIFFSRKYATPPFYFKYAIPTRSYDVDDDLNNRGALHIYDKNVNF